MSRQLARGAESAEVSRLARAVGAATDPEESYLTAGNLSYCGETDAAAEMLKLAIDGNYCSYPAFLAERARRR